MEWLQLGVAIMLYVYVVFSYPTRWLVFLNLFYEKLLIFGALKGW